MKNKKPPFEITNQIVALVAEIAELVGRLTSTHPYHPRLTGHRAEHADTGAGHSGAEWQNSAGSAQGHCRG